MTGLSRRTAKAPKYIQQFECIGSACVDSCCSGWQVDIDKANYKKLKQLGKSELAERLKKNIELHVQPSLNRYARMKLDASQNCPMLTQEKLCRIQRDLGKDYLSQLCNDYPRQYTAIGQEATHLLASLSCPEAARLCLLNEDGWYLEDFVLDIPPGKPVPYIAGFRGECDISTVNDYRIRNFELIQSFALQVLRNRALAMWQRLLLVGLLCERIQTLDFAQPHDVVDRQLELALLQAKLSMMDGSFQSQTEGLSLTKAITLAQQAFIKRMNDERLVMDVNANGEFVINQTFMACVAEAFFGIEYDSADLDSSAERLMIASEAFAEFDAKHPYVLENFLCNCLALDVFPHSPDKTLSEQWQYLMIRYAMVRFYLTGMAAFHKERFSVDHCVSLIYSFSRTVQHNALFLPRAQEFFRNANLDSLATMAILVR